MDGVGFAVCSQRFCGRGRAKIISQRGQGLIIELFCAALIRHRSSCAIPSRTFQHCCVTHAAGLGCATAQRGTWGLFGLIKSLLIRDEPHGEGANSVQISAPSQAQSPWTPTVPYFPMEQNHPPSFLMSLWRCLQRQPGF